MTTAADLSVPFARAVVVVRGRGFDGHTEKVGLRVPVKKPTSTDHPCAGARGIGVFTLFGRDVHRIHST